MIVRDGAKKQSTNIIIGENHFDFCYISGLLHYFNDEKGEKVNTEEEEVAEAVVVGGKSHT